MQKSVKDDVYLNKKQYFCGEIKQIATMSKVIINCYEDFERLLGKEIGTSDYVDIPQDRINLFADATLDHQWIHVDEERCKTESPFGQTIAHGYLTLSLLPHLWD